MNVSVVLEQLNDSAFALPHLRRCPWWRKLQRASKPSIGFG